MDKTVSSLEQADQDIQLAVDLIYLLETNNIDAELALKAIRLVEKDLLNKLEQQRKDLK